MKIPQGVLILYGMVKIKPRLPQSRGALLRYDKVGINVVSG